MCVRQMTFVSCLLIGLAHSHAGAKESLDDVIRDLRAYAAQAKALSRADAAGIQKLDDKVDDLSWRISTSTESRSKKADAARKAVRQLQEYLRNKPNEGDSKSAIQQELSVCERLAPALPRGDNAKRKTVEDHLTQQVWHSRFYLEAVFEEAFDASEFRTGKDRTIVIINDGGQKAVSFKSGGTTEECLQFTYDAAKIGLYFAQKIGDDPAPWHKLRQATEAPGR